ncbi:MAG TPA: hypothetical protein VKP00_06700 [Gemmatimonadaceae bacterium]|nr:hypothetical protein [Gemmatimonadaceae bacterium]
MKDTTHLTEEERQTLADGSIAADREAAARAHLAVCAECADDVARLEQLTMRARHLEDPTTDLAELWPGIRSRIENAKLVTLAPDSPARRWRRPRPMVMMAALVAVLVLAVWLGARTRLAPHRAPSAQATGDTSRSVVFVSDSVRAYEEEAKILLDRLELTRSGLEPGAAAAIEKDLAVIDSAIAELQTAIARDPRNPALQQLLATSYRQKVEVLKRVSNAG